MFLSLSYTNIGVYNMLKIIFNKLNRGSALAIRHYSTEELLKGILQKDRFALAKAITLRKSNVDRWFIWVVESGLDEDRRQTDQLLLALKSQNTAQTAMRIGISGPPGVGKSSLIESFGKHLVTCHQKSLAILVISIYNLFADWVADRRPIFQTLGGIHFRGQNQDGRFE